MCAIASYETLRFCATPAVDPAPYTLGRRRWSLQSETDFRPMPNSGPDNYHVQNPSFAHCKDSDVYIPMTGKATLTFELYASSEPHCSSNAAIV
jgi:hypothetical protein